MRDTSTPGGGEALRTRAWGGRFAWGARFARRRRFTRGARFNAFGEGYPDDGEGPVRTVRVEPFRIDATAVTNARFADFVRATGQVTEAERYGSSFVFHLLLHPRAREAVFGAVAAAPWWLGVEGAHPPRRSGSTRRADAFTAPSGTSAETSATDPGRRVIRGGSYLCHTPDSSTGHGGFRCAWDVGEG
ncbi:SUMF1/EgtB/PvdO family nonheme iron enzyme [Streptomyces mirabilis]|uniref:SUMF1/EgtB/PvdO family nonheme iron enzyme n=1 Tax=Streptomyces mirabilis TaxID=68239 RepID=UPI00365AC0B9